MLLHHCTFDLYHATLLCLHRSRIFLHLNQIETVPALSSFSCIMSTLMLKETRESNLEIYRAQHARDKAAERFARAWLRLYRPRLWRLCRDVKIRRLTSMTHLMAERLCTWTKDDWQRYRVVSFRAWKKAGGEVSRTPAYDLTDIACGLLRSCAPGLRISTSRTISPASMIFSAMVPGECRRLGSEGVRESWHGTSLPFFFRIYHGPQKQLLPGDSNPPGVYVFDNSCKGKAYGYASYFPLLRSTWCQTVIHCAAHRPRRIRGDQWLSQEVYMIGVELVVLRTEALLNSDQVIGVDDENKILAV
jgi:hypothetical protein